MTDLKHVSDTFKELSSGAHLFLHRNLDTNIGRLLLNICNQRRVNLLKLLSNFEDKGIFVMGDMKGIHTIALGEKGLISLCPMVTGIAIQNPIKGCCKNFAANISTSHGHRI